MTSYVYFSKSAKFQQFITSFSLYTFLWDIVRLPEQVFLKFIMFLLRNYQ